MKILPEVYLWTRKSSLNFGSHLDLGADLGIFLNEFSSCGIAAIQQILPITGEVVNEFL